MNGRTRRSIFLSILALSPASGELFVSRAGAPSRRSFSASPRRSGVGVALSFVGSCSSASASASASAFRVNRRGRRCVRSSLTSTTDGEAEAEGIEGAATVAVIDPGLRKEVRNLAAHLSSVPVRSILPRSEALLISRELIDSAGSIFTSEAYARYCDYWDKLDARVREETTRTPADLLGTDATERILASVRGDSGGGSGGGVKYDPQSVRTFLESDAINKLFARILYDAIVEFTIKADVIGNLINDLPLIGPMRQRLVKEQKRQLDRTLGPLVRQFLGTYTRVAVGQAADFAVSSENASAFGKANSNLAGYLLRGRTVAEWIPEKRVTEGWRADAWEYLRKRDEDGDGDSTKREERKKDAERYIVLAYDILGDKCARDAGVEVDAVLDASPALERSAGEFWKRCKEAAAGE